MPSIHKYLDLKDLLASKLLEWYDDPAESESDQIRNACKYLTSALAGTSMYPCEIIDGRSAGDAISQLMCAMDSPASWAQSEAELAEMSESEIEDFQFPDLIYYVMVR
jgi:hypothetical protein